MQSILAALTGPPEQNVVRSRETEPRRERADDSRGFDEAYAERAQTREPREPRRSDNAAPDEGAAADASPDTKRPRVEPARRQHAAGGDRQAKSKFSGEDVSRDVEAVTDVVPVFFDAETAQSLAVVTTAEPLEEGLATPLPIVRDVALAPPPDAAPLLVPTADEAQALAGAAAVALADVSLVGGDIAPIRSETPLSAAAAVEVQPLAAAPEFEATTTEQVAARAPTIDAPKAGEARDASDESDARSAPNLTDIADEAAANLEPALVEAPTAPHEKLKAKADIGARAFEPALEPLAQGDRTTQTPPVHSAPEIRLSPALAAASADAAAQVIAAIRADKGSNEIDVRLDPPELGRVKISLSFERSDIVTATVSSERTDTLDLMRRHQDELVRELERAGFSKVRLDFAAGDSGRAFSDQPQAQQGWRDAGLRTDAIDDVRIHYLSLRTDNRLDRLV